MDQLMTVDLENSVATPRRVLAVDDDPIMLALIAEKFAEMGYGVVQAEDGAVATAALVEGGFELAVVDLSMPKVDGFELLSRIRSNPKTKGLPVIVATSMGDSASIELAYRLGASSFVTKPINWAQFTHHSLFVIRNGQIERDLRVAQADAAAAARMKTGLFAVLGHELKTPLTALVGLTDVLAKSLGAQLQSLDAEHLGHVTEAAQRLNLLVSDVLTLSRALAGSRRLDRAAATAAELVEDSLLGYKSQLNFLGLKIKTDVPADCPEVYCDSHMVRQALRKLVDNAIKFSQRGDTIHVWAKERRDGYLEISVRDKGPGISVARLRDCLQPFVQGDMSYARPAEGLGLGLPIANAIAEAHGGALTVTTTPGNGLTATLCLPGASLQAAVCA